MINFKVRAKNPQFWFSLGLSVTAPVLAYYGITGADITTWDKVGVLLCDSLSNPYVLTTIGASVYTTLVDPTTQGIADSKRALGYKRPANNNKRGQ